MPFKLVFPFKRNEARKIGPKKRSPPKKIAKSSTKPLHASTPKPKPLKPRPKSKQLQAVKIPDGCQLKELKIVLHRLEYTDSGIYCQNFEPCGSSDEQPVLECCNNDQQINDQEMCTDYAVTEEDPLKAQTQIPSEVLEKYGIVSPSPTKSTSSTATVCRADIETEYSQTEEDDTPVSSPARMSSKKSFSHTNGDFVDPAMDSQDDDCEIISETETPPAPVPNSHCTEAEDLLSKYSNACPRLESQSSECDGSESSEKLVSCTHDFFFGVTERLCSQPPTCSLDELDKGNYYLRQLAVSCYRILMSIMSKLVTFSCC